MGQKIMSNICHDKIQRTAEEGAISKASIRDLSSRFHDSYQIFRESDKVLKTRLAFCLFVLNEHTTF